MDHFDAENRNKYIVATRETYIQLAFHIEHVRWEQHQSAKWWNSFWEQHHTHFSKSLSVSVTLDRSSSTSLSGLRNNKSDGTTLLGSTKLGAVPQLRASSPWNILTSTLYSHMSCCCLHTFHQRLWWRFIIPGSNSKVNNNRALTPWAGGTPCGIVGRSPRDDFLESSASVIQ